MKTANQLAIALTLGWWAFTAFASPACIFSEDSTLTNNRVFSNCRLEIEKSPHEFKLNVIKAAVVGHYEGYITVGTPPEFEEGGMSLGLDWKSGFANAPNDKFTGLKAIDYTAETSDWFSLFSKRPEINDGKWPNTQQIPQQFAGLDGMASFNVLLLRNLSSTSLYADQDESMRRDSIGIKPVSVSEQVTPFLGISNTPWSLLIFTGLASLIFPKKGKCLINPI